MLYKRLIGILEPHQPQDQTGFRAGIRIENALVVVETMISRCGEFALPLWVASLDLKKAFDRVEHVELFGALRDRRSS